MRLINKLETCPLCNAGALVAYVPGEAGVGDGSRHPQRSRAHHERCPSTAGGRQHLRVCESCGGAVLHAW